MAEEKERPVTMKEIADLICNDETLRDDLRKAAEQYFESDPMFYRLAR